MRSMAVEMSNARKRTTASAGYALASTDDDAAADAAARADASVALDVEARARRQHDRFAARGRFHALGERALDARAGRARAIAHRRFLPLPERDVTVVEFPGDEPALGRAGERHGSQLG